MAAVSAGAETAALRRAPRSRPEILLAINRAAIDVFSREGLNGASTQAIADGAGLSKAQLHYYIDSKEALYRQLLQDVIDDWITVFGFNDQAHGPRKVLSDYIRRKMQFSFEHPQRSRIYAMEMMRGAPVLRPMLSTSKRRTLQAVSVIQNWIDQGQMASIDPLLLLFDIWGITQFYAEQAEQVSFFAGQAVMGEAQREAMIEQTTAFVLRGAGVG